VVPSLVGKLEGCSFRDRCQLARPACASIIPVHSSDAGQRWRCVVGPDGAAS
jgi:peptide/nickel transport system ATP-binding protein